MRPIRPPQVPAVQVQNSVSGNPNLGLSRPYVYGASPLNLRRSTEARKP